MNLIKTITILAAAAALSACGGVAAFESVSPDLPGAEVRLNKSYDGTGLTSSGLQLYSFAIDEYCDSERRAGNFTWTTGDQTIHRVTPDQPILIWAATNYFQTTSVGMVNGSPAPNVGSTVCMNVSRFTPRDGQTYDVRQVSRLGAPTCQLSIIDLATGLAPEDVEVLSLSSCRQRGAVEATARAG